MIKKAACLVNFEKEAIFAVILNIPNTINAE